jgi:hypothetical protein
MVVYQTAGDHAQLISPIKCSRALVRSNFVLVGGGIELPVGGNGKLDVGYRLMKTLEDDSDIGHRISVGFGWRF